MIQNRIDLLLHVAQFGLDVNNFYNVTACQSDVSLQGYMNRETVDMVTQFGVTLTSSSNGFLYGEFYIVGVKFRIVLT